MLSVQSLVYRMLGLWDFRSIRLPMRLKSRLGLQFLLPKHRLSTFFSRFFVVYKDNPDKAHNHNFASPIHLRRACNIFCRTCIFGKFLILRVHGTIHLRYLSTVSISATRTPKKTLILS